MMGGKCSDPTEQVSKRPGQKFISWVTESNHTVFIISKKDLNVPFPLSPSVVNEKPFWAFIFLRVRILLLIFSFSLILSSFILLLVPASPFSSKPAALPELALYFICLLVCFLCFSFVFSFFFFFPQLATENLC